MVLVLGLDLPLAEFLLFLNIAMLFYIVFTMIEIRSLRKIRRELTLQLEEIRFLVKSIRFSPAIKDSIERKTPSVESKIQKTPPTPTYKPSTSQKAPPLPELPEVEEETSKE